MKPGDREGVLELYEAGYYEQIRTLPVPMERLPRKDRELLTIEASMTYRVEWDTQGRILIPDRLAKFARLGRDVTLVGAIDHYAIMSREHYERMFAAQTFDWDKRYDEMNERAAHRAAPGQQTNPGSPN